MEASRQLGLPIVHEVILLEEPQDPGEPGASPEPVTYQRVLFNYKLGWHNNDVEWLDVANQIEPSLCAKPDLIPAIGMRLFNLKMDWRGEAFDGGGSLRTKAPEVEAVCAFPILPTEADTRDYTKQLQFHEYELSQAEKRHMPASQVAYHFDRLCLLRKMGVSYGG